jgi:hypothetical protein
VPSPPEETTPPNPQDSAPLDERRPASAFSESEHAHQAPPKAIAPPSNFGIDYGALPLTLEARFGFNARLGSSFNASASEQAFDTDFGLAAFLAWRPEYALGVELEQTGLGRVRALNGENSLDGEYSATSAWLSGRVFPWQGERLDLFVGLRIGLALQHVDALGTRQDPASITVPAVSYSCSAWDGPGLGLGAALGLSYRISRHVSIVSRLDAMGERLSGGRIGNCSDGIGSVSNLGGTVALAYQFETRRR